MYFLLLGLIKLYPKILKPKFLKIISVLLITVSFTSFAQQNPNFLFFEQNMQIYNPAFLCRIVSDAPNQVTGIGKISFKNQLQLGVDISNNDYVSAIGMKFFDFGYGYEMGQRTSSSALRANTHELFLRFKFEIKQNRLQ